MDTRRQQKISNVLLKDLGEIFQQESRNLFNGGFITVTQVRVSSDLSVARVYISILGGNKEIIFELVKNQSKVIRKILSDRVRFQLRKTPELAFFIDDSLDYYDKIEELLKK
jgi:ribosome-binding factor A